MRSSRLSETRRGWKFGLMPPPSLRWKAHKVIKKILTYIRAQFAFKLGHCNFPICINYIHTTAYYLSAFTKLSCISYLCSIENPPNVHMGNFRRHWKWPLLIAYLWGLQSWKGRKCNFRDNGELIRCCVYNWCGLGS